jgi:transcriptional regulator NrdR family protein
VLEINDEETRELNNEQLRRIMRNRLQMNDIKMKILSRVVSDVDYQVQAEKQLNINGMNSISTYIYILLILFFN